MRIHHYLLAFCLLAGCSGLSQMERQRAGVIPISKGSFLNEPFSYEPGYKFFLSRNSSILTSRMITLANAQDSLLTDTFYHFSDKRADIYFVHDTKKGHPLFTADIMHPDIKLLTQSIRPGLTRSEFFWRFSDWAQEPGDTLVLNSARTGYVFSFIFSKDVLNEILIQPAE